MRKCLRCQTDMVEDLAVMVTSGGCGIDVREHGIFKMPLAKIKCAVCPSCGYVETYINTSEFVKKFSKDS